MNRIVVLGAVGFAILVGAYFALPAIRQKSVATTDAKPSKLLTIFRGVPAGDGTAAILFWSYATAREKAHWGAKRAARLLVLENRTLVDHEEISIDRIRDYLDSKVRGGTIEYVVVTMRDTPRSESLAVIEQCRRSRVAIVIIETLPSE